MPLPVFVSVPDVPVLLRTPLSVATFASTCTVRAPLRFTAFLKSSVLFAVGPLSIRVPTANGAVPHVSAVGAASPPKATFTGPPFALKPLLPPVICILPAAAPPLRTMSAPVSKTPPLIVSRLPVFKPTPSLARSTPPFIVAAPVPLLVPERMSVPATTVVPPV